MKIARMDYIVNNKEFLLIEINSFWYEQGGIVQMVEEENIISSLFIF